FESCASANSATPACVLGDRTLYRFVRFGVCAYDSFDIRLSRAILSAMSIVRIRIVTDEY
ncbi:hypothetical protein, partial [Bacillus licheniformis]|uniref:hypothetical protein n=1 Tax=Bacillus licheniformis TaxID=1402 RepID=UPI001BA784F2